MVEDPGPPPFTVIARFRSRRKAHEYGLVILSAGAPYWVRFDGERHCLLVQTERAEHLRGQLQLYQRESRFWPPRPPQLPEQRAPLVSALIWGMLLFVCHGVSFRWPELYELGKLSADAVMGGEPYRAFTALFLHADLGHLAGNILFGAVFLHLVARQTSVWLSWLLVLLAGTCGNLLNAALYHPAAHYSIGASTAVFGAVGILVALPAGYALRHAGRMVMRQWMIRTWVVPLVVGLVFLAWFGTGSEQTDTTAHLTGFACGLPLGVAAGLLRRPPQSAGQDVTGSPATRADQGPQAAG